MKSRNFIGSIESFDAPGNIPLTSTDDFTRTDAATLDNGWTDGYYFPAEGSVDSFSILSNKARGTGSAGGPNTGAQWATPGTSINWDVSVDCTRTSGTPWAGVIARATANDTFYYLILRGGSGDWSLRKNVAGVVSVILTGLYTWGATATVNVRLILTGSSLQVIMDGAQQGATQTDTAITAAGSCGMYFASGAGNLADYDNFIAITPAITDTEFTVTHNLVSPDGLAVTPHGYIVTRRSAAASLYPSGTTWTTTTAYFKSSVANTQFTALFFA